MKKSINLFKVCDRVATSYQLNKQFFKTIKLCEQFNNEELQVYLVDGEFIRDRYFTDFTLGGHGLVYSQFIPTNEIWLEQHEHPESYRFTLLHETIEWLLMKFWKMDYEVAHEKTTKIESKLRKLQYNYGNLFEQLDLAEFDIHPKTIGQK